ncbi:TlpA disulfide reductase family protein [Rugosimonospora acidiphila]|uniref:TlpA disulfide reductase family protein n=1 Tax=Rugosimonospora acidiphila TaxID=556531 RepID=A0ABP9RHD2_9ACTN
MRRILLGVAAAVAALTVVSGCSTGSNAVSQTAGDSDRYVAGDGKTIVYPAAERKAAPKLTGDTVDGGTYNLAAHKGQVVVLNFWASWCAPCRLEASGLEATYKATENSGVTFLGVNSRDEKDAAKSFESDHSSYPSLFDPNGRVPLDFSDVPTALPCTLIIDRTGKVAVVIRNSVTQSSLTPLVNQIAAEKA